MAEKDRVFRAREKEIRIKVTEAELQYTKDKSRSCGLTVSEYIRQIIFRGLVIKLETFDIKELSVQLNRIGTNINQIAKHVNTKGGDYDKQDIDNLLSEFQEMQEFVYAKALGIENDSDAEKRLDGMVYLYGKEFIKNYLKKIE